MNALDMRDNSTAHNKSHRMNNAGINADAYLISKCDEYKINGFS